MCLKAYFISIPNKRKFLFWWGFYVLANKYKFLKGVYLIMTGNKGKRKSLKARRSFIALLLPVYLSFRPFYLSIKACGQAICSKLQFVPYIFLFRLFRFPLGLLRTHTYLISKNTWELVMRTSLLGNTFDFMVKEWQ